MWVSVFLAAYGTVLLTELIGDRSLYTIGTLSARFGVVPVFWGISVAFMLKMLAAVLLGHVLGLLPQFVVRGVGATTLLAAALAVHRRGPDGVSSNPRSGTATSPTLIAFLAIFLTEWADPGQLTAAMLSARYADPVTVWAASTAALLTKGLLAIGLGLTLRRWVAPAFLRTVTTALLVVMAVMIASGL